MWGKVWLFEVGDPVYNFWNTHISHMHIIYTNYSNRLLLSANFMKYYDKWLNILLATKSIFNGAIH